jgi:hypothetical protein
VLFAPLSGVGAVSRKQGEGVEADFDAAAVVDAMESVLTSASPATAGPAGAKTGGEGGVQKGERDSGNKLGEGKGGGEGGAKDGAAAEGGEEEGGAVLVDVAEALKGWTGKTPKKMLEEFLQKGKLPRPRFVVATVNPARCCVCVGSRRYEGPKELLCAKVAEAEQVAATFALFKMAEGRQLHRMMPLLFRDLWLQVPSPAPSL